MLRHDVITIFCFGGCGRSVTLRARKVLKCDFYTCDSKIDGRKCFQLWPRDPNKMIYIHFNAAAGFTGYVEFVPDADDRAAVARANRTLRAGLKKPDKAELELIVK